MSVSPHEILEVVAVQLGRPGVARSDRLIEDLGADSADLLNLVVALEDRFGISIGEEELAELGSVEDVLALVAGDARPG